MSNPAETCKQPFAGMSFPHPQHSLCVNKLNLLVGVSDEALLSPDPDEGTGIDSEECVCVPAFVEQWLLFCI